MIRWDLKVIDPQIGWNNRAQIRCADKILAKINLMGSEIPKGFCFIDNCHLFFCESLAYFLKVPTCIKFSNSCPPINRSNSYIIISR